MWFIEAKCVTGTVKSPEENSLTLSHCTFPIFTYI